MIEQALKRDEELYNYNWVTYTFMIGADPSNIKKSVDEFKKEVLDYALGELMNITGDYINVYKNIMKSMVWECLPKTLMDKLEKPLEFTKELKDTYGKVKKLYDILKMLEQK